MHEALSKHDSAGSVVTGERQYAGLLRQTDDLQNVAEVQVLEIADQAHLASHAHTDGTRVSLERAAPEPVAHP